jgi:hypothetical protein
MLIFHRLLKENYLDKCHQYATNYNIMAFQKSAAKGLVTIPNFALSHQQ